MVVADLPAAHGRLETRRATGQFELTPGRRQDVNDDTQTEGSCRVELHLNGTATVSRAGTLQGLLVEQGFAGLRVATAVNGSFVPEHARAATALRAGDRVEVLTARQGG
jgi:sulfur carrier protein